MPEYVALHDTICDCDSTNGPESHVNPIAIDRVMDDLQDINEPAHDVKFSRHVSGAAGSTDLGSLPVIFESGWYAQDQN